MEPTQVTFTKDVFTIPTDLVCDVCGASVSDNMYWAKERHIQWHIEQEEWKASWLEKVFDGR